MNTALQTFQFQTFQLRVEVDEHCNPWFCAKDACDILGYANSRDIIKKLCKPKGVSNRYTLTDGGQQSVIFIDEGNLYRLIIKSNKPEAEPFESLVCDEILPSIRKTGGYIAPNSQQQELLATQRKLIDSQEYSHQAYKDKATAYINHLSAQISQQSGILASYREISKRHRAELAAQREYRWLTMPDGKTVVDDSGAEVIEV